MAAAETACQDLEKSPCRAGGVHGGPRTAAGKARTARNALKHGLRARRPVLLDDENASEFRAFQAAARAELAPSRTLQSELVERIVTAAWRARRGDRLEAALLGCHLGPDAPKAGDAQAALSCSRRRRASSPSERSARCPARLLPPPAPRPNEPEKSRQNRSPCRHLVAHEMSPNPACRRRPVA